MRRLERLASASASATVTICAAVVVVMCIHVSIAVVSRAAFSVTLTGTIEIVSSYYMVTLAFLPWVFAQQTRQHITVDVVFAILPNAMRRWVQALADLLTMALIVFFTYALIEMATRQTRFGELVETGLVAIPIWPGRWVAVAGAAGMAVVLGAQLLINLRDGRYQPTAATSDSQTLTGDKS